MSLYNHIYNASPVWLQNILVSLYGWQWNKRRFGGVFQTELAAFKKRESYSNEQWKDYTNKELVRILLHAYHHVPFYKEKWETTGISIEALQQITTDNLHRLPFLEKDDLRKFGKTSLLSDVKQQSGTFFLSSGTTGTPTAILFSKTMHQKWSAAYEARVRNWAGVNRYMSRGMTGGRRVVSEASARAPFYRYNSIEKQIYFSAYHIAPDTVQDYVAAINKYRPDYLVGYAMSHYFLARLIKEKGLTVPAMRAIITSSEKLTQDMRDVLEQVYQCKAYDGWSGVEACGLVSECEHGSLHISPDVGYVELLNEKGKPVLDGEIGEVVCTGFLNDNQPLIRYRIGDYMRFTNKKCDCGRQMPVVEEIIGRIEDVVIGKDGREMVRFHGIFIGIDKIQKGQIVQETLNDITINVQVDGPLTVAEREVLTKRIYSQLKDVNVQIFEMKEIPCAANGKFRAVVSKVKRVSL